LLKKEHKGDMDKRVPALELKDQNEPFSKQNGSNCPQWNWAIIFSKVNQYYFTGTMQDGMLIIPKDEEPVYWVGGVMNVLGGIIFS
jgi:Xaa-Pro dipeptidase